MPHLKLELQGIHLRCVHEQQLLQTGIDVWVDILEVVKFWLLPQQLPAVPSNG